MQRSYMVFLRVRPTARQLTKRLEEPRITSLWKREPLRVMLTRSQIKDHTLVLTG